MTTFYFALKCIYMWNLIFLNWNWRWWRRWRWRGGSRGAPAVLHGLCHALPVSLLESSLCLCPSHWYVYIVCVWVVNRLQNSLCFHYYVKCIHLMFLGDAKIDILLDENKHAGSVTYYTCKKNVACHFLRYHNKQISIS